MSTHIQAVIALTDKLLVEICQAKRDTKILLRFLNNLCVEVDAADADLKVGEPIKIENETNDLQKTQELPQTVHKMLSRIDTQFTSNELLYLKHIDAFFSAPYTSNSNTELI